MINNFNFTSAYRGGLIASLTYPARSKAIDTFEGVLQLPKDSTIWVLQWSSMWEMLQETSDPVLQVILYNLWPSGQQIIGQASLLMARGVICQTDIADN